MHLLASRHSLIKPDAEPPLATWHRSFAPDATGTDIDPGHSIAEENPEATVAALLGFFEA